MLRRCALLVTLLVVFAACSDSDAGDAQQRPSFGELTPGAAEPSPPFKISEVVLQGEDADVTIDVQVAATDAQRSIGLMGRSSMPDDVGMYFLFEAPHQGGFWMKNTLIPLSIAFIDGEGTIVDILDMQPCESDPCEIYTPDSEYLAALEVNEGMFDEWGISEGDRADLTSISSE